VLRHGADASPLIRTLPVVPWCFCSSGEARRHRAALIDVDRRRSRRAWGRLRRTGDDGACGVVHRLGGYRVVRERGESTARLGGGPVPDLLQAPERGLGGKNAAVSTIIHAIGPGATRTLRSLVRPDCPGQPAWRRWPV
jgi:hypothetical protein